MSAGPLRTYTAQAARAVDPIARLLVVFDAAIAACGREDRVGLRRALTILVESLDFAAAPEAAAAFWECYREIGALARRRRFDDAAWRLRRLREAWDQAREALRPRDRVVELDA